ncbi:MAG: translation initiation factor IF-2 [Deltaproteobacteria bacterium]|nr:translation initiation factor IF-2 [Deltaproteobacteria bacterium]MBW2171090.1 translation initiation factor IF-2 [Deltaproteobacteria bacterium]
MGKIRIYELAKQFGIANKVLLEKLAEMGISVKSHMSAVDEEAVQGIKEAVFGSTSEIVVEKRVKSTVIRRRKKVVEKKLEVAEVTPVAEAEPEQKETLEVKPVEIVPPVSEEAVEDKVAEVDGPDQSAEGVGLETPVEVALESPEEPEKAKPAKKAKAKKKPKTKKEQAAKIIKMAELKPVEDIVSKEELVAPVGEKARPAARLRLVKTEEKVAEAPKGKGRKKDKKKPAALEEAKQPRKKKTSHRKKEVLDKSDLYDDKAMRARRGRRFQKGRVAIKGEKTLITTPKAIKRRIKIDEAIVVSELAKRMGVKAGAVIKELMTLGVMATLNQAIDFETAAVIASEFEYEVEKTSFEEGDLIRVEEDDPEKLKLRPPVVTVMGHVDHGKTRLLDAIRETNVVDSEAGGITQHIGAYHVTLEKGQIVFLDTPGHEAFTAMRARGAEVTDLVVLVVAADDGVMPQTLEAVNHAKAADVPIMVAVNKIDKPEAEPERVRRQLAEHGISPEEWGGDTVFVDVSAKEGDGIEELLEMILLQAEVLELRANHDKLARGYVIEARLDPGRGAVATVLVQEGTLRAGHAVICGHYHGKVRAMTDDRGERVDSAGPSIPVEIQGLSGVPMAGNDFMALADEKAARQVGAHRAQKQRIRDLAQSSRLTLEKYHEQIQGAPVKDLNMIIRADVQGSVEALSEATQKIESEEVKVKIVHSATGAITESDIMLAAVSNAMVIGFNVRPNPKVRDLAVEQNIDIRFYDVIYNVVSDIKGAMAGLMEPKYVEHVLGRAEVREVFHIPKVGTVAGSHVTDGKIQRGQLTRLLREEVVVYTGKIGSLRRFKDDVKEVQSGYECGIGIENFNDVKVADVVECYEVEEIQPVIE